jgi:hypothetical protein
MGPNPVLTLVRGKTYTFQINTAANHPFEIDAPGVSNNNISSGILTFAVPADADNTSYFCSVHFFGNDINIVDASAAPTVQIVSLSVSTNILLRSTGTNGWTVHPEYITNLTSANWAPLTVQSNSFINGTNETICGRPPDKTVYIRIRSQPQ